MSLKGVDFFCGGGGMTYGLSMAGIEVVAGIDIDPHCKDTYEYNNPNSKYLLKDISTYSPEELEQEINIKKKQEDLIFIGCSPCQFWTIINTDKTKSQKTKNLIEDFGRFVSYFEPGYVLIENVPGILKNKKESPLTNFLSLLDLLGYKYEYKIVNMNDYGVPQNRKRFSLIASRHTAITLPFPDKEKTALKDAIGEHNNFPKIKAGHRDTSELQHSCAGLSEKNLQRIRKTSHDGGKRKDWKDDEELQLNAYHGKDQDFSDNYSRMWWDKPAPTITTKFLSLSNGRFGHPEEDRAISLREGATLQTFPKNYIFKVSSLGQAAKIIGNAVPPEFAKRLGITIKDNHGKGK